MLIEWHDETPRPDATEAAHYLGEITRQYMTRTKSVRYYSTDNCQADIDAFNTEKRRVLAANIRDLHHISKRGY